MGSGVANTCGVGPRGDQGPGRDVAYTQEPLGLLAAAWAWPVRSVSDPKLLSPLPFQKPGQQMQLDWPKPKALDDKGLWPHKCASLPPQRASPGGIWAW